MKTSKNIIIIGGGPAALVAGCKLLDAGNTDFLILEKGNSLRKRSCPGVKENTCKFCEQGCYMTDGIGGANGLFGNKICYFPASQGVTDGYSDQEKNEVYNYLNHFQPFIDTENISEKTYVQSPFKFYTSDVLNKIEYAKLIEALSNRLVENGFIRSNVDIVSVSKQQGNSYTLVAKEKGETFQCQNLVLSTGRSAHKSLKQILDTLQISYSNQCQDVGFRIETSKQNFTETYYYQIDPKIKFNFPGLGSARTFCAHNQGLIVPIQFGRSFFADGAFEKSFTGKNNIALMVRSEDNLDNELLENWCEAINGHAKDSLVVKKIYLFNKSKGELMNEIFSALPSYPTEKHSNLMRLLIENLFNNPDYEILKDSFAPEEYLSIYGPAIDRYWVSPEIDLDFQSNSEGCFIIGDAAAKSRGVFQAMFSGAIWANRFIEKNSKAIKNDKIWSGRVSSSIQSQSI